MGYVKLIEDANDFKEKKKTGAVVVDFYAEWCGPCQVIGPKIELLAEQHKDKVKFYKVDVDKLQQVAKSNGVSAMPTFLVFKDGELRNTIIGANLASVTSAVNAVANEVPAEASA